MDVSSSTHPPTLPEGVLATPVPATTSPQNPASTQVSLCNLPTDMLKIILQGSNYETRLSLSGVCRSLRAEIESLHWQPFNERIDELSDIIEKCEDSSIKTELSLCLTDLKELQTQSLSEVKKETTFFNILFKLSDNAFEYLRERVRSKTQMTEMRQMQRHFQSSMNARSWHTYAIFKQWASEKRFSLAKAIFNSLPHPRVKDQFATQLVKALLNAGDPKTALDVSRSISRNARREIFPDIANISISTAPFEELRSCVHELLQLMEDAPPEKTSECISTFIRDAVSQLTLAQVLELAEMPANPKDRDASILIICQHYVATGRLKEVLHLIKNMAEKGQWESLDTIVHSASHNELLEDALEITTLIGNDRIKDFWLAVLFAKYSRKGNHQKAQAVAAQASNRGPFDDLTQHIRRLPPQATTLW